MSTEDDALAVDADTGGPAAELERILRRRADALARPLEDDTAPDTVELAVLRLGRERYALELRFLEEVRAAGRPAPLPGAPPPWAGVTAVRGKLYPVVDLSRALGLPEGSGGDGGTVVLVSVDGMSAGLLVDDVPQLLQVARGDIEALPDSREGSGAVRGITPDLVSILDPEALFADPRLDSTDDPASTGGDP